MRKKNVITLPASSATPEVPQTEQPVPNQVPINPAIQIKLNKSEAVSLITAWLGHLLNPQPVAEGQEVIFLVNTTLDRATINASAGN